MRALTRGSTSVNTKRQLAHNRLPGFVVAIYCYLFCLICRRYQRGLEVRKQAADLEDRAPLIDHADGDGAMQNPKFLRSLKCALDVDAKPRNGRGVSHLVCKELDLPPLSLRRHDQVVLLQGEVSVHIEAFICASDTIRMDDAEETTDPDNGGIGDLPWVT